MHSMKQDMGSNVKEEITALKPSLVVKTKSAITLQDDVRKELKRIKDQKTRAINLIKVNAPESDDKNNAMRKAFDETEMCALIKTPSPDAKNYLDVETLMKNQEQRKDHSKLFLTTKSI